MSGLSCSLTSGTYKKVLDEIVDWSKKQSNRNYFKDPYEAAIKVLETEVMAKFEQVKHVPITEGQVGSFKARLKELLKGQKVSIQCTKEKGKFGRILADVMVGDTNINKQLIDEGHAREYQGGKKIPWV